jgi:hypothetical protein
MKVVPSEGKTVNLKHEPFASAGKISITKPVGMTPEHVANMIEDFCQHDSELANFLYVLCYNPAQWSVQHQQVEPALTLVFKQHALSLLRIVCVHVLRPRRSQASSRLMCAVTGDTASVT